MMMRVFISLPSNLADVLIAGQDTGRIAEPKGKVVDIPEDEHDRDERDREMRQPKEISLYAGTPALSDRGHQIVRQERERERQSHENGQEEADLMRRQKGKEKVCEREKKQQEGLCAE